MDGEELGGSVAPSEEAAPEEIKEDASVSVPEPEVSHQPSGREIRSQNRYQKLANENSFLRGRLNEYQSMLEDRDRAMEAYRQEADNHREKYESALKDRLLDSESGLRDQLRQAKVDGDVDREVEIVDRLTELKMDRARLDMLKAMPDGRDEDDEREIRPLGQHYAHAPFEPEPQLHEPLAAFYDRNPWADPQSPHFDAERANRLNRLSDLLDKQLQASQKQNLYGTPTYFKILENVANRSPEGSAPEEEASSGGQLEFSRKASRGLDVNRTGASHADAFLTSSGTKGTSLDAKEVSMARQIGRVMGWSDQVAFENFAKSKRDLETGPKTDAFGGIYLPNI